MAIEEIFDKIFTHMNNGIAFHNEVSKAYSFLGLFGYAHCHTYHAMEEFKEYIRLSYFCNDYYHKMNRAEVIIPPDIVPDSWYKYTMREVDNGTRKNAIRELSEKWVAWEKETKKLYQAAHKELEELGEIAAVIEIDKYIEDVSKELAYAEKELLQLETVGYDMSFIMKRQKKLYKKYKGW